MPETVTEEKQNEGPAETPKESRNIVLTGFGGLKTLKVLKKPEPKPAEGEVLISVKACGLNFVDLMVRQGVLEHPPKTPLTIGFECAGDVEAVGENTEGFAVNDRVIGFINYGAWGEKVTVQAKYVYKMPSNMSYQDGSALPMNYLAAYIMLFDIGNLKKGMTVFSHNIGGGVGNALGQLCKTVEDVNLYGTASEHKHEAVKDNVTNVFNRTSDYCQEVRKLSPEGVDIVLDCMCGEDTNKGISLLKPMGKYILYGSSNIVTGETKSFFSFAKSWWQVDKVSPIKLYDENKTISGFQLRNLAFQQNQDAYIRGVMNELFKLYTQGKIHPVIDSSYAFEDIADAMMKMHDRKNIGKLILDPTMEPKPKVQSAPSVEGASPPDQNKDDKEENKDGVVNGEQQ
ncbi:synaptic vesicle membrane protein VAT-1 homolog-like isoform X2 [Ruditapes philippinarum]|nr:synaptic vesicle membrane protein VAT-1 homolog-like isoform X2 [Ruditapes philippinarum]XP_060564079.1 synaptic vesicle membrane protein VAT-1 homolog-like isoform X2 [Ruditapes philippinarum]XP_060564080.1 synaptic vesicle membrane protein VAT-1 homolog-like isoform X2 [Ruditapes philippinarum]XP_060564081.1 synaptic vesicle membrane protein VAT-1 homolog-like isoform X2 [Ruditapes philippinarum]